MYMYMYMYMYPTYLRALAPPPIPQLASMNKPTILIQFTIDNCLSQSRPTQSQSHAQDADSSVYCMVYCQCQALCLSLQHIYNIWGDYTSYMISSAVYN